MQDFRNIVAWQRAHELTLAVYLHTRILPNEERFAMQSQMRRAAFSVPANIAEGSSRRSDRDFLRFLEIAAGSLKELQYFVILAKDLGYFSIQLKAELEAQMGQTFAPLIGLMKHLDVSTPQASSSKP
jgi:four helix bundle protein